MGLFGFNKTKKEKPTKGKKLMDKKKPKDQPIKKSKNNLKKKKDVEQPVETYNDVDLSLDIRDDIDEPFGEKYYDKGDKDFVNDTMKQGIFLYVTTSKYTGVSNYINTKPGLVCVGTSKLSAIKEVFKSKLDVQNILIIMSSEEEATYIVNFLNMLIGICETNENLYSITLIGTNKSNKSKLITASNVPELKKFVRSFDLKVDINDLTEDHVNKIIQTIIQKQPAYVEPLQKEEEMSVLKPKKKQHVSVDNIFNIKDIDNLRKSVNKYKSKSVLDREILEKSLEDKILMAKDPSSIYEITDILPEVKIIREYMRELDQYIKEVNEGSSEFDMNELLTSKMESSLLEEEVIRDILDGIIKVAKTKIEEDDIRTRDKNENLLKEISESEKDIDTLLIERNKLKERITNNFYSYKKEVQLLSNTIVMREMLYKDMRKSLSSLLKPITDKLSEETSELAYKFIQITEQNSKEYSKLRNIINQKLADTVDYTNKIFRDFNILISIDDIIIEGLREENKMLKANYINRTYVVDTLIKEKGKIMILTDPTIKNLTPLIFSPNSLIISFISDIKYPKKSIEVPYTDLLKEDFNYSIKFNVLYMDRDDEMDMMDIVEPKLEFLAKNYSKVFFLCDEKTSDELIDRLRRILVEAVFVSDTNKDSLLRMNKISASLLYNNNMFIRQIFNNWNKAEISKDSMKSLLGITTDNLKRVSMSFISTNEASGDPEKLKKIIYTIRNI